MSKALLNYRPKFFDLFSGCGGLSLGLEQAGFDPALFSELSPDARATYLHNRKKRYPYLAFKEFCVPDVEKLIDPVFARRTKQACQSELGISIDNGELDLLVGGPPCQGYSTYGHRRSYAVDKKDLPTNHLFIKMISSIKLYRPKIFLFENVQGLLNSRWTKHGEKGEIWREVLGKFHMALDDSYLIRADFVRSKDYGVPQNRPRVFIVGISKNLRFASNSEMRDPGFTAREAGLLPQPTEELCAPALEDLLGDLLDPNYCPGETRHTVAYPSPAKNKVQRKFRTNLDGTILRKGALLTEQNYSLHSPIVIKRFTHMINNNGEIPEALRTKKASVRLLPRSWDHNGPNITATSLPDDYVHFHEPRILTVREWARLQTFPDWYEFRGPRTTGGILRAGRPDSGIHARVVPKYTQIGNAIPVDLARCIGEHLLRILRNG